MWFNEAKRRLLLAFLGAVNYANLKVMLVSSAYVFNPDQATVAAIVGTEISVGGYARQTLTGVKVNADLGADFGFLDADDAVFPTLATGQTVGGAVIFYDAGSDAASWPVAWFDLADTPTNGSTLTIMWAAAGAGAVFKAA